MEASSLSPLSSGPNVVLDKSRGDGPKNVNKSGRCVMCNKASCKAITMAKVDEFRRFKEDVKVGDRVCKSHYKQYGQGKCVIRMDNAPKDAADVSPPFSLNSAAFAEDVRFGIHSMSISAGDLNVSRIAYGTESTLDVWEKSWTSGHVWLDFVSRGNPRDSVLNWLGENEPDLLKVWQYLDNSHAPEDIRSAFLNGLGRFAQTQLQWTVLVPTVDEEMKRTLEKEMAMLVAKEEELIAKSVMFVTVGVISEFFKFARLNAPTVFVLLERAINVRQKEKRNKSREGNWAHVWLGFVLVQLVKLRSQRANLFGYYFFGYFYFFWLATDGELAACSNVNL